MRVRQSLETRLARLEEQRRIDEPPALHGPLDEDDWLAAFEEMGQQGNFKTEPDFPNALAFLRDALARAHASVDPPFDPPDDYQTFLPSRRQAWRTSDRFPEVSSGMDWLLEMAAHVSI